MKRRFFITQLNTFVVLLLFVGCGKANTNNTEVHYFINSLTGNDGNSGTSVNSPWKSLKNLEEANFQAGDSILFAKDSEFQGGFTLKNSGKPGKPIVISNYVRVQIQPSPILIILICMVM